MVDRNYYGYGTSLTDSERWARLDRGRASTYESESIQSSNVTALAAWSSHDCTQPAGSSQSKFFDVYVSSGQQMRTWHKSQYVIAASTAIQQRLINDMNVHSSPCDYYDDQAPPSGRQTYRDSFYERSNLSVLSAL